MYMGGFGTPMAIPIPELIPMPMPIPIPIPIPMPAPGAPYDVDDMSGGGAYGIATYGLCTPGIIPVSGIFNVPDFLGTEGATCDSGGGGAIGKSPPIVATTESRA